MVQKLFSEKEREILSKSERHNSEELLSWRLPNMIFPIIVVGISIVCYWLFKPQSQISWIGALNLLINGSLPMFALNRLASVGINLFKFDKSQEKKASTNTYNLRIKINEYSKILVIVIGIFYIYQVINAPFNPSWWILLQLAVSALIIYIALTFSRYSFFYKKSLWTEFLLMESEKKL